MIIISGKFSAEMLRLVRGDTQRSKVAADPLETRAFLQSDGAASFTWSTSTARVWAKQ